MSLRRAAPGPQLSAGRIRVDAAKAIAKLREYQLADRNNWVLEAIRAAVAAKAMRIELSADANDVWLAWEGEPWRDELLPRLFDELVSPEAASETHHVRLLAAAVNSALGVPPAYVDVIAIRDGTASRVRYTPEILVEPSSELGDSALRHVAVEAIPPPDNRRPGMLVHLRRRLTDWHMFSTPPELVLARAACRDIPVTLRIQDDTPVKLRSEHELHRDHNTDIVRVPLGDGIEGYLAVIEPQDSDGPAVLQVAERGVLLAEYPLVVLDEERGCVPIRVFVDAPRMPTNASRSQVRRDAFPIDEAEKRAHKLLATLMTKLGAACEAGDERAREAALALIAAGRGGTSRWHVEIPSLGGALRELTRLPLVKNAVGQPRALTAHWRAEVHTDAKPFSVELAPWLDEVLWAPPGDPTRQLIDPQTIDVRGTRRLARYARRQLRAQKQFFAHTKREIRVLSAAKPHVRVPLGVEVERSDVPQELFADLQGEVCIYAEGQTGALAILLDGRQIDRVEFDSPLSFDVVIDSRKVIPGDRYRGVKRDAEYKRVERAMRAGLVRALEAYALAKRDPNHAEIDAKLFRKGFGMLSELGVPLSTLRMFPLRGPLAAAPAYTKRDGTAISLAELAKEEVIGYVAPGWSAAVPQGRTVLVMTLAERNELAELVKARLVAYRRSGSRDVAEMLSTRLGSLGGGALIVREPGLVAAVTPSTRPQLELYHLGAEVEGRTYLSHWLPCTIAIDSDALVPDEDWTKIVDDAGLAARDYSSWELALVRAIAHAVTGTRPAELSTPVPVQLDTRLGRALCEAVLKHDPMKLLGKELVEKLRSAPLLHVLGGTERVSIAAVAKLFPAEIPYIEREAPPAPGFAPLVAPKLIAEAMAKLVVRQAVDGAQALERHYRHAERERRLALHRMQPQRPMTVPSQEVAPIVTAMCRGLVGYHPGVFEIRVFVEGRPFATIHPPDSALPLSAVVELDAKHCDDGFESVTDEVRRHLALEVRAAIPALCLEVAKQRPHLLGEVGPVRTLLAGAWRCNEDTRKQLAVAPAFLAVQGKNISIDEAEHSRPIVSVAAWQGEWLGPEEGESPHALDAPILFVPNAEHDLSRIVEKLHPGSVIDVTDDVARLQWRRRIARGLVPAPKVPGAMPLLVRPLKELGDTGKKLGAGEIALVEELGSSLVVYKDGIKMFSQSLQVMPSVAVAVELAEAQQDLGEPVQELAVALAKQVLARVAADVIPPLVQRNLVRAGLARRLDRNDLLALPVWRDFLDQIERFGDAWVMTKPTDLQPLDPTRRVFFFEGSTLELAQLHNWNVVAATKELELDAIARANRSRKPEQSLEVSREGVLAHVTLDGDGVTAPRGIVAVLDPRWAGWRGVWPLIKMHPLDSVEDPCRWPTVAKIDDARLTPDRTWSKPVKNEVWQALVKELRVASENAIATVGEAPDGALGSLRINNHATADVAALRKAPRTVIRGRLWLDPEPRRSVNVQVCDHNGVRSFTPVHCLSLGGKLLVFAPDEVDLENAVEQLCRQVHGKLVRQLLRSESQHPDRVAAHVAHALFAETVRANDVRGIEFPCFSPKPLDARGLSSLLRRDDPVVVIRPDTAPTPEPDVVELVDDRSVLAKTIIADLGERVRRQRPAPKARPAPVDVFQTKAEWPKPPPPPPKPDWVRDEILAPEPPKPPKPHPLRPLVIKLRERLADLGIGGYRWTIVETGEPMFAFTDEIEVAGDNARLRALAAALLANSPLLKPGIDVVIAHLVTVLNVALSQITDASEAYALGVLLANPPSADRPRSRRSS